MIIFGFHTEITENILLLSTCSNRFDLVDFNHHHNHTNRLYSVCQEGVDDFESKSKGTRCSKSSRHQAVGNCCSSGNQRTYTCTLDENADARWPWKGNSAGYRGVGAGKAEGGVIHAYDGCYVRSIPNNRFTLFSAETVDFGGKIYWLHSDRLPILYQPRAVGSVLKQPCGR